MYSIGPEVDPDAGGQVNVALGCTLIQDRCDQNVWTKKVLVTQIDHARVVGKRQHQRTHNGNASRARFIGCGVNIWQQTIAELEIAATNRFYIWTELPRLA